MRNLFILAALIGVSSHSASAQVIPFDSARWQIDGAVSMRLQYNGEDALYLKGAGATIADDPIVNGEIEFDVAFSAQRGFSGAYWRLEEGGNREEFYFRPHQSGNEDANQYNPVLSGVAGWQLYFGPSYSAPIRYRYNEWMHVRIVFFGSTADIYVESEKPVLSVALKNAPIAGSFGVYASNFAPAYYANFQYRRLDARPSMGTPTPEEPAPDGAISQWDVSSSFEEERLTGSTDLPEALRQEVSWSTSTAESTGIINLARHAAFDPPRNTVLARTTVTAETEEVRLLTFGYSDRAAVYLNGQLLYRGNNNYQSRDYRYLGTIGLFDEVPLRLRRGPNELIVAVSENFGGWGLLVTFK